MNCKNGKVFIYNLIFSPTKAIEYAVKNKEDEHMGIALLVLVSGIMFNLISKAIISLNPGIINAYIGLGSLITVLNYFGNIILFTAIIFFFKSFSSKRKGNALLFFKMMCFSFIPLLFTPILSIIGLFLSLYHSITIYYLLKTGIYLWIVFLQILIVMKIFELKLLYAVGLYTLPLIGIFAFVFIKVINFFITIFSSITL